MSNMLADVITAGTATGVRRAGFTLPAAGKTGTTNDYRDAWFVGYTPKLVTGVWVGYDMPRTIIANGYAAELAVPIWGRFMKAATKGDKPEWFKAPATVTTATICRLSGKLARDSCRYATTIDDKGYATTGSTVYTEHFIRGTEPTTYCPFHGEDESFDWRAASAIVGGEPQAGAVRPVATSGTLPEASRREPESDVPSATAAQRRGFWGRVFGRETDAAPATPQTPTP
jgi:membrane carboxypeptidase/penicillin-binding protein